jgi:hypothetical protein
LAEFPCYRCILFAICLPFLQDRGLSAHVYRSGEEVFFNKINAKKRNFCSPQKELNTKDEICGVTGKTTMEPFTTNITAYNTYLIEFN